MKRSDTIVLVLMGATTATAAGAYMLPSRQQCQTTPAAVSSTATPGMPATATSQPCRSSSSSSSSGGRSFGFWPSGSRSSSTSTSQTPSGTSVALAPSSSRPSAPATSSTTTSRGGFGTTGSSHSSSSGS